MRYADAVASYGSVSEAARRVFVSQPALTESIRALEEELRIAIFTRSNRGISVTREGEEFLASARQILDDAARIKEKYTGESVRRPQFAVSCQHYAFAVEAFMEVVKASGADAYDFTLRETVTSEIIDDVARHRSEIGILYLSQRNERAITKILKKEELVFEELYSAKPHVFLGKRHPLAKRRGAVKPQELDEYPYLTYEQGLENALYFAEEVMPAIDRKKSIRVRDRATMTRDDPRRACPALRHPALAPGRGFLRRDTPPLRSGEALGRAAYPPPISRQEATATARQARRREGWCAAEAPASLCARRGSEAQSRQWRRAAGEPM